MPPSLRTTKILLLCLMLAVLMLLVAVLSTGAEAAVYFMAETGSDAATCDEAHHAETPKATFASVIPCLASGDTLLLREGVYTQTLTSVPSGTFANRTVVSSFPGEQATLRPSGAETSITLTDTAYVMLRNLRIDGGGVTTHGVVLTQGHDNTLADLTIWHVMGSAILLNGTVDATVRDSTIFDQRGPAISLAGGARSTEVARNVVIGFGGACLASQGEAAHLNTSNIFRANRCLRGEGPGAVLRHSQGDKLFNNVLAQSGGGVRLEEGVSETAVLHNTVADNVTGTGVGVRVDPSAQRVLLSNNIVYGNTQGIVDPGSVAQQETNFEGDPFFVRAPRGNYRPQINSKALKTGTNRLAEVSLDALGQRRTVPVTPGAFERVDLPSQFAATGCTHYASPSNGSPPGVASNNGTSPSTPFRIADFWNVSSLPGKKLCLLDGIYKGAAYMIQPPNYVAGAPGNPVTITALNDGHVLIDQEYHRYNALGEYFDSPIVLAYPSNEYIVIEGINAAHGVIGSIGATSISPAAAGESGASHNVFRRVIAWDGVDTDCCTNAATMGVAYGYDNTWEDVVGFGCGRKTWSDFAGSGTRVSGAFFIKYKYNNYPATCLGGYGPGEGGAPFSYMYDSLSTWYFNTIVSQDSAFGGNEDSNESGTWDHDYYHEYGVPNPPVDVLFTLNQNLAYDVAPQVESWYTRWTMGVRVGPNSLSTSTAFTDARNKYAIRRKNPPWPDLPWAELAYCGVHPCNDATGSQIYFVDSAGSPLASAVNTTDVGVLPLSSFQNGLLQLNAPSQPANGPWMRYQFLPNGTRTSTPLWPWPMEQRIVEAIGGGTYGSSDYASRGINGVGGLNLTATIEALTGSTIVDDGWDPVVNTFYFSPTGTQTSCALALDPGTPFSITSQSALATAFNCGLGGSTYVFYDGTYPPIQTSVTTIPVGSASGVTTVRAGTAAGTVVTIPYLWLDRGAADSYLHFKDLVFDSNFLSSSVHNVAIYPGGGTHITVEGGELLRAGEEAVLVINADAFTLKNASIHTNNSAAHALLRVTGSTNVLLEALTVYDGDQVGINLVDSAATVNRARVRNNAGAGIDATGTGAVVIKSSIIDQNGGGGIVLEASKTGVQVFNNTIWSNTAVGLNNTTATGTQVTNNIIFANATAVSGTPTMTSNVLTDPTFVAPGPPSTFHVSGATVIGQGTPLASVTVDFAGQPRTDPYTIGAYEDEGVVIPPPPELTHAPRSALFFLTQ